MKFSKIIVAGGAMASHCEEMLTEQFLQKTDITKGTNQKHNKTGICNFFQTECLLAQ